MTHKIDNQYRYGIVYDLNGQIVGFNLSPDFCVTLTDREIERALENYIAGKGMTSQPKMGRWIAYEVRLPDRTILNYRCSVCGRKLIGYNTETLSEAPFCHCGAKMEMEET